MAAHEHCIVDYGARFDKRHKLTHRTTIADVNGPLTLTVPLSHPERGSADTPLRWSDMKLSRHDEWWNIHRVAMESAYGRTPFFEYYIDRFLPAWNHDTVDRFGTLVNLNRHIDREVRRLLDLPPDDIAAPAGCITDMRREEPAPGDIPPYYQVRAARLGFIPGLSILDLLFNLGPEAQIYLYKLIQREFNAAPRVSTTV